ILLYCGHAQDALLHIEPNWSPLFTGEKVTFVCDSREGNDTDWNYSFSRNDHFFTTNRTVNRYKSSSLTRGDSGEYQCVADHKIRPVRRESNKVSLSVSGVPRLVLTVSPSWTSPGDSVTLTCSVEPPSAGWRFFWYKAVPHLPYNYIYTYELLAGGTTGTQQDSYILHGQTHTAGYVCRARRGDPVFYTLYSGVKFVWSGGEFDQTFIFLHKGINVLVVLTLFVLCVSPNDVSSGVNPAASLTVSPHRLQHFSTESLSLICEGNSTEWRVMKVDEDGDRSPCSYLGKMTGSTCNTDARASSGVYWYPRPVLTVSPSWTSPGDSVTLTCSVEPPSAGWRFFWYKAVPQLSRYSYTHELLAGGTTGTEQDSYILHGQTHTAGYACRAGRGDPVSYTQYSDVEFVLSGGVNPAASLTVSPHRLQHFSTESLSLICEGNSTEWRVMKVDEDGDRSPCSYLGKMTGSTCNTDARASSGVYWCESETQSSNAANITIHSGDVILVSPVRPVTEGHSVTLGCKLRTENLLYNVDFYKNDKLIPNPVRGELLISAVTKSDEGFYKCRGRKSPQGLETLTSAESWLSVKWTNDEPEESDYENVRMEIAADG
uniref:Ig-like domain-containing protein n=1 Tax=Gasterosteus aculeatus aculeatus TaxID=481459 RepID=A0AAQ4PWC1_GASAC